MYGNASLKRKGYLLKTGCQWVIRHWCYCCLLDLVSRARVRARSRPCQGQKGKGKGKSLSRARARARACQGQGQEPVKGKGKGKGKSLSRARARACQGQGQGLKICLISQDQRRLSGVARFIVSRWVEPKVLRCLRQGLEHSGGPSLDGGPILPLDKRERVLSGSLGQAGEGGCYPATWGKHIIFFYLSAGGTPCHVYFIL